MNATCKATTNAGEPCKAVAVKDGLCALHANPTLAAEMGRKSGRARRSTGCVKHEQPETDLAPPETAQEIRAALGQFISDVRARRLDPKVASTLGYLSSVLLKSIEVADVEGRLAALESVLGAGVQKRLPRS
jgi:Family of unknown function (DUF5763)